MGSIASRDGADRTLLIDDLVVDQAADVLRDTDDDSSLRLSIELPTGRRIEFPNELAGFILGIVEDVSHRHGVAIRTMPESLTTSVAATELGISRPTLMKFIERGELEAYKVGTHTRLRREDVAAFKLQREERIRAAAEAVLLMDDADDS